MPDKESGAVHPGATRLAALEAAFQEAQQFITSLRGDSAASGAVTDAMEDRTAPPDECLASLKARIEALETLVTRQADELAALKAEVAALKAEERRREGGLWPWRR
jgi:septal ring factor EnvC (AmiA/AmiB activator)